MLYQADLKIIAAKRMGQPIFSFSPTHIEIDFAFRCFIPLPFFALTGMLLRVNQRDGRKRFFKNMKQTMRIATCCSTLSFKSCVLSEESLYSCMNDSICSLSTHIVVSATWSSSVMFQTTRQHTAFYCDLFRCQDIVAANDLVARRQRAKPNLL